MKMIEEGAEYGFHPLMHNLSLSTDSNWIQVDCLQEPDSKFFIDCTETGHDLIKNYERKSGIVLALISKCCTF